MTERFVVVYIAVVDNMVVVGMVVDNMVVVDMAVVDMAVVVVDSFVVDLDLDYEYFASQIDHKMVVHYLKQKLYLLEHPIEMLQ